MTDNLCLAAEEKFGITIDPDGVKELREYILNNYGAESPQIVDKVFASGEAAGFLTVSETYFFREPAHFSFLGKLLPSFEKAGMVGGSVPLHICCAAVATGCEAYSIAMFIEAYNKTIEKPLRYHIDAFDINPKVIETACKGSYSSRALREDGSCFRYMVNPYLEKPEPAGNRPVDPTSLNGYQIAHSLQKNINFFVHNLMDELPPKMYDIIFFRNAFIYFSQRNRERILSNLCAVLKENGTLIMGVSETAGVHHAGLQAKNQNDVFYFEKSASEPALGVGKAYS